ncbi:hypothetical protein AWW70_10340 [Bacillus mycoides]|uniref:Uncharacterized protein n=1 Tax=Bacillus mycoides TaxID=1405 RepID=A0A109GEV8_BACMY|nr:hypothetical protein [Bacillus mycoides]KWU65477.1 hypothetical protein AWW70_10340 [Bacillus mycoides]
MSLYVGFYLWYSTGKHNYKQQNRPAYNKGYVNKAARKAGLKLGLKAFVGVRLIENAYVLDRKYTNGINKHIKTSVKIIKNPESDLGEFDDEF